MTCVCIYRRTFFAEAGEEVSEMSCTSTGGYFKAGCAVQRGMLWQVRGWEDSGAGSR